MFTQEIVEFIENRGFPQVIGTCDNNLQPAAGRAFGVKIEGEDTLAVYIPESLAKKCLENVKQNNHIAVTRSNPATSTTFQFKGEYKSHAPCTEEDMGFVYENFGVFLNFVTMMFGPEAAESIQKKDMGNFIVMKVKVNEIFNQTPGPGAGKKIN